MSVEKTDFAYWAKMPHWTLDEALTLVFGKDPEVGTWKRVDVRDFPFIREYRRVRKLARREKDLWQPGGRVLPSSFLAWAKRNEIEVPPELVREVESREKLTDEVKELRGRIAELEQSAWEGFDPDSETYPCELDIAMQAWRAVTNQRDPSKTVKEQIREWLGERYPDLSKEARERITIICNWEKAGGRKG